jgi:membrane protein DedA with SNARE-associated domain
MGPYVSAFVSLVLGAQLSEDLACITAGEAVHRGALPWSVAVSACFVGIYVGDLLLWVVGRIVGQPLLQWKWMKARLSSAGGVSLRRGLDERLGWWVFASRIVPGSRLPVYLAIGAVGRRPLAFAGWALLAAAIWAPLLVLGVALLGRAVAYPIQAALGAGLLAWLLAIASLLVLYRLTLLLATTGGRERLTQRWEILRRWEFWPAWMAYPPVLLWIGWLALRHGGLRTVLFVNPGIPHSGVVGESKFDILRQLRSTHVARSELIPRGDSDSARAIAATLELPVILKPDVGQRGAGVRLARSVDDVVSYVQRSPVATVVQPYHAGPFEAGIFYYRLPGEAHGRLFSITDKVFPEVIGDGTSTLRELILRDERRRIQSAKFFARHRDSLDTIIPAGERVALALAGNHCQGTLFRDGAHLITPELERAVDAVARTFEGFHFGRFDVRYSNVEGFRAGHDFTIIELNGLTSESTNVYDPSWSIWRSYRVLMKQWSIAFQIGAANRRTAGGRGVSVRALVAEMVRYYRGEKADELSA